MAATILEVRAKPEGAEVRVMNGLPREHFLSVLAASAEAWLSVHEQRSDDARAIAELLEAAAAMVRQGAGVMVASAAEIAALGLKRG
jgi:predicted S18 family serine protease